MYYSISKLTQYEFVDLVFLSRNSNRCRTCRFRVANPDLATLPYLYQSTALTISLGFTLAGFAFVILFRIST